MMEYINARNGCTAAAGLLYSKKKKQQYYNRITIRNIELQNNKKTRKTN